MARRQIIPVLSLGQAAAVEVVLGSVERAVRLMGRPFELVRLGAEPGPAPALAWLNLAGPLEAEALARLEEQCRRWPRTRWLASADRPPVEPSPLLAGAAWEAFFSDPVGLGEAENSGRDRLWLGLIPELEEALGRQETGPGYLDRNGGLRLAKLLSRLLLDPTARPISPLRRPLEAMIEIVRACNLRCPLCPIGSGQAEKYPHMDPALFEEIVARLAPTVWKISLYNYGEPLLHPELGALIARAKGLGIEWLEISTNGTVMPPGLAEGLVAGGLDFLRVSADGASQETYAQYRVGGDIQAVWDHIGAVRRARRAAGAARPIIEAQLVVSRFNEHEMGLFKARALEAGADQVRFKTFNAVMSGPEHAEEGRGFLPSDKALSRYADYGELVVEDSFKLASCHWPWERLVVNADGSIVPCCYDYNGQARLGRLPRDLDDWWDTAGRREFRRRLAQDPAALDLCRHCPSGAPDLSVRG